jgi:phospholipid/cholesterol/gamma-HCH transport system permease protein
MAGQQASIDVADNMIRCRGRWTLQNLADLERQVASLRWPEGAVAPCDTSQVTAMDTGGAVLLQEIMADGRRRGQQVALRGLQEDFSALLARIDGQIRRVDAGASAAPMGRVARFGQTLWKQWESGLRGTAFLGESAVTMAHALRHPRYIRWRSLLRILHVDGVNALPITGLLTFLVGVVIAYQGAEQLRKFGTNIFIVDLVGISLLREIAPLIVAILIAGRSGSAYAAEIGTMKVTEELDAVRTLGISPMALLVLPRTLALMIAVPLLTVYADVLGVFGGMLIASGQLNVSFTEFVSRFQEAVAVRHFLIGIGKAPFFAMLIALVGCYQGFQIRGGVDDVGRHTTISVVQGIFLVIVFDAICSILLNWWDL